MFISLLVEYGLKSQTGTSKFCTVTQQKDIKFPYIGRTSIIGRNPTLILVLLGLKYMAQTPNISRTLTF